MIMVKKTFCTPQGNTTRELTDAEIEEWANLGDEECRIARAKKKKQQATSVREELDALWQYLG